MPQELLTVERVLDQLSETPRRIATVTSGETRERLHSQPAADEWSVNEVLAHLRACADVWGGCIDTVLSQDMPTIRALSPRTWIRKTDYLEQDFESSFAAFQTQRAGLLTVLEALSPESWSRAANVIGAGKPFVHTVHSYAHRLATHEREHLRQIERILKP